MSADAIRSTFAEAGLERYADQVCAHLDALGALPHRDRAAYLKEHCNVSVLGHRHRVVALLSKSLDVPDLTDALAPPAVVDQIPSARPIPVTAEAGIASRLPKHLLDIVVPCEKMTKPLPFQGSVGSPYGPRLAITLAYPGLHLLHADPPVYACDDLLTTAECDLLVRMADPLLKRSLTDSGKSRVRTSQSTHLRKELQPCPSVLAKVSRLTGKPISHMEIPQVARYESGEFYEPHFDAADKQTIATRHHFESGGQRIGTVLIYLNDVPAGGHTRFNRLGFEVKPRKGTAVVFFPGYLDGGLDPNALHEARPAEDRKYVCQIWVKQDPIGTGAETEYVGMGHRLLHALHTGA